MANEVSDANFETEVLKSDTPVMVDFWAPWCGPCRALAPTIDELATEYNGKVKIVKLNTDENSDSAMKYRISSIPCMIVFKGGEPVDQIVGAVDKDKIKAALDKVA